jgi:predicted homoserine dehydrogenase-like protein
MNSVKRMQIWAEKNHPARVAVVGAGFVGKGLVYRLSKIEGINASLVINRSLDNGLEAYVRAGHKRTQIVVSDDVNTLSRAIDSNKPALTSRLEVLQELKNIDVVFEATGAIDYGARAVLLALRSGKHVVSMNAELDATIGYLLHYTAAQHGVVYTISDGDQPGVILRQLRFVEGMGFEIVAAVNCKRYLDPHQTPDNSKGYATRDANSVLMATAFGDGTKMNIEQCIISNVTGLLPDCRGMHGVETTLDNAAADIVAALSHRGAVEYTLGGDFKAGVGVVGFADDPIMDVQPLRNYKMGDGPFYFFFRPYHLVHFEAPFTIADVMVDNMPLGSPSAPPYSEVVSLAKQDLSAGIKIDGIGGASCYGQVDTVQSAKGLLPVGISEHARLLRNVRQDEPIRLDDVELDEEVYIVQLRAEQDRLIAQNIHKSPLSRQNMVKQSTGS